MILHRRIGASVLVTGLALARGVSAQPAPLSGAAEQREEAAAKAPSIEDLQRRFLQTNDPEVGLELARSLAHKKRWLEADAFYREVSSLELSSDSPPSASAAKAVASSEREELLKKIPAVVISIESADESAAQVFVNDVRLPPNELGTPHRVDPGAVRIRGVHGGTRVETVVEVGEGETRSVRLALNPKTKPAAGTPRRSLPPEAARVPSSDLGSVGRVVGFVAMGVGGAAVVTGGVFGVLALRDQASLGDRCPNDTCPGSLQPDVDAYESKKTIAAVGLVGGVLVGLGGAVLYLMSGKSDADETGSRAGVFWAGQRAGVWGSF